MSPSYQAERPHRNFQVAISLPNAVRVIGNCGIQRKPEHNWEADIGYGLAPEYWESVLTKPIVLLAEEARHALEPIGPL